MRDSQFLIKLALIFFGILFLVCVWLGREQTDREAPEGEKISVEDVQILMEALGLSWEPEKDAAGSLATDDESGNATGETSLTYAQYIDIYRQIDGASYSIPDFADFYRQEDMVLKSDWYEAYRLMLAHLDPDSSIWETTVFVLKIDAEEKKAYTENGSMQGAYEYCSSVFEQNVFQEMKVYIQGDKLLTIVEVLPEEHYLGNVWVMESTDGVLECFYRQVSFTVAVASDTGAGQIPERERIADLTFSDGKIIEAIEKNEKVHGKLLRIGEGEIEVEGCGTYKIDDRMEVYKLYGTMETLTRNDLKIGYADTDFVISKDKVCACLVSGDEAADRIRVLIRNTANNSNYHEEAKLMVDGETIKVREKDLEIGERKIYKCANLTDKIQVTLPGITKEDNMYRGSIECYRTGAGMVLINELPLEEYLYAVVPSEMPASYPMEALKAQAVCARTYGYRYILHAGVPELGAHVDDTIAYQVYHNCSENSATTRAVKETDGMILTYQGEPAENYYYSTSCGVGTDTGIWKSGGNSDTSYMQATRLTHNILENMSMAREGAGNEEIIEKEDVIWQESTTETDAVWQKTGTEPATEEVTESLREENIFRQFIQSVWEEDLEKEEPWYRWTYQVEEIDEEAILKRMQERYQAAPEAILTKGKGDYYVSEPIESFKEIRNLEIVKRGAGGVADELVITTKEATYKIIAEYNIRYILCDRVSEVVRQDGTITIPKALLPSGFFVIETGKSKGNVVGYTLIGGGYGHGVGMSQNGARALGKEGADYGQILSIFFPGCEVKEIRLFGKSGEL